MSIPYVEQTWTTDVSQTTAARMAYLETGIYDAHTMPSVRAKSSSNQSFTTAVEAAIAMDSEDFDTHGMHSGVTNNSRLTCQHAGKYIIGGHVEWADGSVGLRLIRIKYNGTTNIGEQGDTPASAVCRQSVTSMYSLAVNDYVELFARQDSGGAKNVIFTAGSSAILWAVRVA